MINNKILLLAGVSHFCLTSICFIIKKCLSRGRCLFRLQCTLFLILTLSSCASHPDCEVSDIFGHCKKWKGVENSCEQPDFLGFCPPSKNISTHNNAK